MLRTNKIAVATNTLIIGCLITLQAIALFKTTNLTIDLFIWVPQTLSLLVLIYSWVTIGREIKRHKLESTFATERYMTIFLVCIILAMLGELVLSF